ncbi:MAG TPA: hypothetical protein VET27_11535 [Mycobacterium sp.]|nr:hypothetical protein [Mycobacterium sp.]
MAAYLRETHPHGDPNDAVYNATAPLWPSRKNGGGHRATGQRYAVPPDWTQPLALVLTVTEDADDGVTVNADRFRVDSGS